MRKFIASLKTKAERRPFRSAKSTRERLRAFAFALLLASVVFANPSLAWAEEKIALVIGNSEYRKVQRLPNPVNDAADMAASLQRLGFTVKHLANLDFNGFRKALIEFGNEAKTADKAAIFFAGHGVEIDGKNWLIPVDAEIRSELDVYAEAINLETLIDISVMPKLIGLVILDACRNDPFASTNLAAGRSLSGAKNGTSQDSVRKGTATTRIEPAKPATSANAPAEPPARGLAPVEVNDNVLVAFAAAAGTTANDGTGRNSPYSGSLLRHVETPGLEINYLFRNVHDDVVQETKTQEPAVYGTLSREEIYLRGGAPVAMVNADAEAERVAWTFVRSTNDVTTLRRFAEQYPASTHAGEVRDRIAQLEDAEKSAWTIVERQKSAASYRAFLDLYPFSDHVETARVTLASIEASGQAVDSQPIDLPNPPASTLQLASSSQEAAAQNPESIEKAWDVLKESRDQNVVGRFSEKYPSARHGRLPAGSDLALRPVSSTEWMLRTADDDEVNRCFAGASASCVTAIDKYPDFVQLRFQLCRTTRQDQGDDQSAGSNGCMQDAVEDARQRGYLVSAYTRSEKEKLRNLEYRKTVAAVQQNVGNVVSNVISNVVSNVVSNSVSNAASAAASNAASSAAASAALRAAPAPSFGGGIAVAARPGPAVALPGGAAPRAASPILAGTGRWDLRLGSIRAGGAAAPGARTAPPGLGVASRSPANPAAASNAASSVAGRAASGAAGRAASGVAGRAAGNAASSAASRASSAVASRAAGAAASHAAGRAASVAASNAAGRAASNAAGRAASNAASNAASRAASHAASKAASNAAANAASRIPSDVRLKRDITLLAHTDSGLRLYRYRYIGDDTFYVGVMAQEVADILPTAVSKADNGYLEVDYGLLGLEFRTYRDWRKLRPVGASK
jgi:uncharacterized caspase-like protein